MTTKSEHNSVCLSDEEIKRVVDAYIETLDPVGLRHQIDVYSRDEVHKLLHKQKNTMLTFIQKQRR
jgi:hypothetical protein